MTQQQKVIVSTGSHVEKYYHTDPDCINLPEKQSERPLSNLSDEYQECNLCAGTNEKPDVYGTTPCPTCEEPIKRLRTHLPCDGS